MSPINLSLIFISGLNVGMAILILYRNYRNKINVYFSLTIMFVAMWILGVSMFREADSIFSAKLWTWVQNGFGAAIVVPFFLFSVHFPYKKYELNLLHKFLIFLSSFVMLLVVVSPNFWVNEIIIAPHDNNYILNPLGLAYFNFYFLVFMILSFHGFILKYLESSGFLKRQLWYVLVSTGIASVFGYFFAGIMPLLTRELGLYWIGPFFSLPMVLVLTLFIVRKNY